MIGISAQSPGYFQAPVQYSLALFLISIPLHPQEQTIQILYGSISWLMPGEYVYLGTEKASHHLDF